ncbi:HEAT repeat domain-containing protein [Streptomyces sp. NPDC051364]|uniref:HEAT repeat domain-containing protein n=1 Tax=Streptomyces sp. NPDC051364 TaxID=3155799 RepID=UPI0034251115
METWIREARRDPASAACGLVRRVIFDAVLADRTGPVAVRLLDATADERADVRLLLLEIVTGLSGCIHDPWPEAAAAAVARLRDPDEPVRRAAAWLLAEADHRQAVELLTGAGQEPDPVARLALAEALLVRPDAPQRQLPAADRDPAIRLRAARRPDTEAVLADLDAAGARLGGPGGRMSWGAGTVWGLAARSGDENTCYEHVGLLAARDTAVAQRAAVDMAEVAVREWRAAPEALVPHLRPLLGAAADPGVRAAAAALLGSLLETTRLCAGELAGLLDELPDAAAPALARIGDVRALPQLCRLVAEGRTVAVVGEAAEGLAGAGADAGPLVAAATEFLDRHLDRHEGATDRNAAAAVGVLRVCGAASAVAVPQLLCLLGADDAGWLRTQAALALGEIGPGAAAAVPLLEGLAGGGSTRFEGHVEMALIRITGERRRAERLFARLPAWRRNASLAADLLEWFAEHGGLEPQHVAYLWEAVDTAGAVHPKWAAALWRHEGAAAAALALEVLPRALDGELYGPYACTVLGDMGAAAAPAVPALRAVAGRRVRVALHTGSFEQDTRGDERLAAAARGALHRIGESAAGRGQDAREFAGAPGTEIAPGPAAPDRPFRRS